MDKKTVQGRLSMLHFTFIAVEIRERKMVFEELGLIVIRLLSQLIFFYAKRKIKFNSCKFMYARACAREI